MSKKTKYYGVKKGYTIGVFDSWDECSSAVTGYPGADYKSFVTREEAEAYISETDIYLEQIQKDIQDGYIVAYTDGSFDTDLNKYSYGVCIINERLEQIDLCAAYDIKQFDGVNNIAGEVFGVLAALDWTRSFGYSKIKIYHDYEGLAKWAKGEWAAKSTIAQFYVQKINEKYAGVIEYDFVKVKGHNNNPYNNRADQLAELALKDGRKITFKGAYSFVVTNITRQDLDAILDLIIEEKPDIQKQEDSILSGIQITLKLGSKKTVIKYFDNGKLLVQGKPTIVFQMLLTNISTLLGTDKLINIMRDAYRWTVKKKDVDGLFDELCYNLPANYPTNGITLIRQAIINKICYIESEDYAQYAFPALKALEGHIKYLISRTGIVSTGSVFVGTFFKENLEGDYEWNSSFGPAGKFTSSLEKCYNYYHKNRHTLFHYGDIIGHTDSSRMISSKQEADEIINKTIQLINETV